MIVDIDLYSGWYVPAVECDEELSTRPFSVDFSSFSTGTAHSRAKLLCIVTVEDNSRYFHHTPTGDQFEG